MDKVDLNPIYIALLYVLRCLVPLGIMLGLSYLLRRLGLIKKPPPPPENWNGDNNHNPTNGGLAHG
jgi:hypothetical protein